jgi:hypothetical protein
VRYDGGRLVPDNAHDDIEELVDDDTPGGDEAEAVESGSVGRVTGERSLASASAPNPFRKTSGLDIELTAAGRIVEETLRGAGARSRASAAAPTLCCDALDRDIEAEGAGAGALLRDSDDCNIASAKLPMPSRDREVVDIDEAL